MPYMVHVPPQPQDGLGRAAVGLVEAVLTDWLGGGLEDAAFLHESDRNLIAREILERLESAGLELHARSGRSS